MAAPAHRRWRSSQLTKSTATWKIAMRVFRGKWQIFPWPVPLCESEPSWRCLACADKKAGKWYRKNARVCSPCKITGSFHCWWQAKPQITGSLHLSLMLATTLQRDRRHDRNYDSTNLVTLWLYRLSTRVNQYTVNIMSLIKCIYIGQSRSQLHCPGLSHTKAPSYKTIHSCDKDTKPPKWQKWLHRVGVYSSK